MKINRQVIVLVCRDDGGIDIKDGKTIHLYTPNGDGEKFTRFFRSLEEGDRFEIHYDKRSRR